MASKDITFADLARERINILGLHAVPNTTTIFVSVEYQYKPVNTPHTWHKIVIPITGRNNLLETILNVVKETKSELEG